MLDPVSSDIDAVTVSQLEGAMGIWSDEAFRLSSKNPQLRRFTFDVPLPALVVDAQVAQRLEPGKPAVCMTEPLVMIAGRSVVLTWYAAMCEALRESNEEQAWHLFNAALSVPIRMRVLTDSDACNLAALTYGEKMFAASAASGADNFWRFAEKACALKKVAPMLEQNLSGTKLEAQLKDYGLQFKGKPITTATATALKGLHTFVVCGACAAAYALAESYFPELREPTLLMRIGSACSNRAVSDAKKARDLFVFLMHSFRALRLTGDFPKEEKLTVSRALGRDKKTPGMLHALFKKMDLVEFIFHEASSLLNEDMERDVAAFKTPREIVKRFATSGADGLVASHRASDSGGGADGMETMFAIPVVEYRNAVGPKTKAMIDVLWALWSGAFDEEITELAQQEMQQNNAPAFAWHTYLMETSEGVGARYRAYITECTGGPIPVDSGRDANLGLLGVSEYGAEQLAELHKLQDILKQLRRAKVKFLSLPSVGGASGAEYTQAQLQAMWDAFSLGHRFGRTKTDVRAFVLSADLFPPNLVKQGRQARLTEQVACDEAKLTRVIEFFAQKRHKDDIIILLDGRSRDNRHVIESCEKKVSPPGSNHTYVETWHVYKQPTKKEDPRAPRRPHAYSKNNRETAIFSLPAKGAARKVMHRAGANACGENSTADTSYTGTAMRRFSELPRMTYATKASILGEAVCGSAEGAKDCNLPGLQGDVDSKGHPFSYNEVKPISMWQEIMEHHKVTHIVDFTPGSGALAVAAASGAMEYEGAAANNEHRDWLDSIVDRCVMYKAGHEDGFAEHLCGGDAEFVDKAAKYFSGTMLEAKRLLMPLGEEEDGDDEGEEEDDDEAAEE